MPKYNPHIAIVVLNYNGFGLTEECLSHLSKISYDNKTVILVDNCSTEKHECEKLETLSALYDHFLIIDDQNRGFGGGMNYGADFAIKNTNAEFIYIYSNDIFPRKNFFENMHEAFYNNDKLGIAGPLQYIYGQDKIYCAGSKIKKWTVKNKHITNLDEEKRLDWVNGAVFAIRRKCYEELSGFDEFYYCWYEDCDLSLRALKKGWDIDIIYDAVIDHKVAQTVGNRSIEFITHKCFYKTRNRFYFVKQHKSILERLVFFLYFCFWETPFAYYKSIKTKHGLAVLLTTYKTILMTVFLSSKKSEHAIIPDHNKKSFSKEMKSREVQLLWGKLNHINDEQPAKVAIYGAGKHSQWMEELTKEIDGPTIVGLYDDKPNSGCSIWGLPAANIKSLNPEDVDYIILSTDYFQLDMDSKCRQFFGEDIKTINLYDNKLLI